MPSTYVDCPTRLETMNVETQGTYKKCDVSIIKEEAFMWHIKRLRISRLGQRRNTRVHRTLRQPCGAPNVVVGRGPIGLGGINKVVEGNDGQFSPKCWRQRLWETVRVSFQLHTGKAMVGNHVWTHLARERRERVKNKVPLVQCSVYKGWASLRIRKFHFVGPDVQPVLIVFDLLV